MKFTSVVAALVLAGTFAFATEPTTGKTTAPATTTTAAGTTGETTGATTTGTMKKTAAQCKKEVEGKKGEERKKAMHECMEGKAAM